jgi:L-fucose isomerase-like protein
MKIGYMPLGKGNWREPRVETVREHSLDVLRGLNPLDEVIGGESLVTTDAEALELLARLEAAQVDVLIFHFITFAPGTIVPLVAGRTERPFVLWSMPEPPMEGGRISSNSFCAANLNAHALWKMDARYLHVHAAPEVAASKLRMALGPVAALQRLRRTKIGIIGSRAPGFFTSAANELLLRRELGVELEYISLLELVRLAEKAPEAQVTEAVEVLKAGSGGVCGPSDAEMRKAGALWLAFQTLKEKYRLDAFSVKCWPDFAEHYGIGVCAVVSLLNERAVFSSCEGDVYGTVMMIIQHEITGGHPFFADLISIDGEGNTGVAWHCGAAPRALCRADVQPRLARHCTIEGGDKKGVVNEFPLRAGRVTIALLSETKDNNGYRMLITSGEALETEQILRGNPLRIRFDAPLERFAETLIYQGFEHHFSIIHGEVESELLSLCRLLRIEPVVIK